MLQQRLKTNKQQRDEQSYRTFAIKVALIFAGHLQVSSPKSIHDLRPSKICFKLKSAAAY